MLKKKILAAGIALAVSGAALADTVHVSSAADSGVDTFRAAVAAATADPAIDTIEFDSDFAITLDSEVHYAGHQDLAILGSDSTISGDCALATTWDGGLFASYTAASITINDLSFLDSCNNGVAVFIPEDASGEVAVSLHNVSIEGSRFHGLYIDNQDSTGAYNTDDIPHPDCADPHPYDSAAGVVLHVSESTIEGNGQVEPGPSWPQPVATCDGDEVVSLSGCPYDFDGIRVDDGGDGGIYAMVEDSSSSYNLADGIEYDERGSGDVESWAFGLDVNANGETTEFPIVGCDFEADPEDNTVEDLDDGFDIDEEDNGELYAYFADIEVSDNRDEGLDLDEAGNGSATVVVDGAVANGNEDQGIKVDESNNGSMSVTIVDAEVNGSLSQHGTEFTEEDNGSLDVAIIDSEISGNDDGAVAGEQTGRGHGQLRVIDSNLTGNDKCSFDELDDSIDTKLKGTTTIDPCP